MSGMDIILPWLTVSSYNCNVTSELEFWHVNDWLRVKLIVLPVTQTKDSKPVFNLTMTVIKFAKYEAHHMT